MLVKINDSSILAFKIPAKIENTGFKIIASHLDAPSFKIKPKNLIKKNGYLLLNTEGYGGMLMATWFDKPLALAGRLILKTESGIESRIINIDENLMQINNLAIHMNREANSGYSYNAQQDLLPLFSLNEEDTLEKYLANKSEVAVEDIMSYDLFLYPNMPGYTYGFNNEFVASYHLDDLACTYTSLQAFLEAENNDQISVLACFDNEETGSLTRQGAYSNFERLYLEKLCSDLGLVYEVALANTLMLSADNAHAYNPNYEAKYDQNNRTFLNKGLVIKSNANQSYTSDALSLGILKTILDRNSIPYQFFTNRSDVRGGSTLGNLANSQVSIMAVDVGLAQLAMHSTIETVGYQDVETAIKAFRAFYLTTVIKEGKNIKIK